MWHKCDSLQHDKLFCLFFFIIISVIKIRLLAVKPKRASHQFSLLSFLVSVNANYCLTHFLGHRNRFTFTFIMMRAYAVPGWSKPLPNVLSDFWDYLLVCMPPNQEAPSFFPPFQYHFLLPCQQPNTFRFVYIYRISRDYVVTTPSTKSQTNHLRKRAPILRESLSYLTRYLVILESIPLNVNMVDWCYAWLFQY